MKIIKYIFLRNLTFLAFSCTTGENLHLHSFFFYGRAPPSVRESPLTLALRAPRALLYSPQKRKKERKKRKREREK